MSSNYKILGINDEVTVCECCGKSNLKKTVILDNGLNTVRYGVNCAATLLSRKKTYIENAAINAENSRPKSVKYYNIYNETNKCFVGGSLYALQFTTLELAEQRINRMAENGLVARIEPVYNY